MEPQQTGSDSHLCTERSVSLPTRPHTSQHLSHISHHFVTSLSILTMAAHQKNSSKRPLAKPTKAVARKRPARDLEASVEILAQEQDFVPVRAHGHVGAEEAGLETPSQGMSSRFSFDIPKDLEPTLTDSMSLVVPLPENQRIWSGHYVDLHGFLPQVEGPLKHTEVAIVDGRLVSKQESKNIRNIEEWTSAFLNFMLTYCEGHPSKFRDLTIYMKIVRFIADNFEGYGWRIYDIRFRIAMGANPTKSWANVDQELWALYVAGGNS